jgi:AraC-like DNA-binding protein/mannose-6-phosphate isomerase-like protein (cupin superfamily)
MRYRRFPWKNGYSFVEPGINADGVRIYPFDPSFPLDVSFVTVTGRRHTRMNRHEFFEVIYVYSGNPDIQVLNRNFRVKKGDLVVIGPNLYHRIINRPKSQVKLISLNFQPEVIRGGDAEGEQESYFTPFVCQDSQFPHVIPASKALPREALQLILRVHSELPAASGFRRLAVKTYIKMLLLLLLKYYADYLSTRHIVERKRRDIERLQPLYRLLEQKYGERIQVRDAARACAMSGSHFMRFFKQTTGQSFRAYLTSFRIAKAQALLSNSDKPIAEISERVAFCGQSYFGEVFRTLVGMTPLAYRRRFGSRMTAPTGTPSPGHRTLQRLAKLAANPPGAS